MSNTKSVGKTFVTSKHDVSHVSFSALKEDWKSVVSSTQDL